MASDNRTAHEGTLEQPSGMTDTTHKPTLLCLYEALREADGAPRIHGETNWVQAVLQVGIQGKDSVCGRLLYDLN